MLPLARLYLPHNPSKVVMGDTHLISNNQVTAFTVVKPEANTVLLLVQEDTKQLDKVIKTASMEPTKVLVVTTMAIANNNNNNNVEDGVEIMDTNSDLPYHIRVGSWMSSFN